MCLLGIMDFGEVSVKSRGAFDIVKHLTRKDAHFGFDLDGKPYDSHRLIQPMVKSKAIGCVNAIIKAWGWGTAFGHSFWISGASHYLSQKVSPEIIHIAGHWHSLAYEVYIRAFKQVASHHLGGLLSHPQIQ